jgi:hypothetical protein
MSSKQTIRIEGGLKALALHIEYTKAQKRVAQKLFSLVMSDQASDSELKKLVTQDSMRELIFFIIEHTTRMRAVGAQGRSKVEAGVAKLKAMSILSSWLDKNISRYKGRLGDCAADALKIKGLGRGYSWVEKQIARYRKEKGLK